jgi:hypothetical protein
MRPLTLIAVIVALLGLGSLLFLSWLGGGATTPPASSRVIRLGPQSNFQTAERLAIAEIAQVLRDDPSVQFVEARWTDSYLLGFAPDHQWTINYDRRSAELEELYMQDGPHERWSPVQESVMQALASRGFDKELLLRSGSRSHLP